jgi:ABC-type branched-subunit amino acid transport system ATPase component
MMRNDSVQLPAAAADQTAPPTGSVLAATDVSVSFGGLRAVTGVDIAVERREVVAVIGPNGAGKTTLLNAISGLVPMTGELAIDGVRPKAVKPQVLARLGLGRSFQSPQLIEHENAIENVVCGAHLRSGYNSAEQIFRRRQVYRRERLLAEEARDLLAQMGLGSSELNRPVVQLTHGTRKRVDIARALMARPKLLLMDEPTSGMGGEERRLIKDLVQSIRGTMDTAVLMVEHHMDVVRAVCDRAVAMQTGSVLMAGPVAAVLESDTFVVASLGRSVAESLHEAEQGDSARPPAQDSPGKVAEPTKASRWRR